MIEKTLEQKAQDLLTRGQALTYEGESLSAVEVYVRQIDQRQVTLKKGHVKEVGTENLCEIALRIGYKDQTGYAVTTNFEDLSLFTRALLSLQHQKNDALTLNNFEPTQVQTQSKALLDLSLSQHVDYVKEVYSRAQAVQTMPLNIMANRQVLDVFLCNSAGFKSGYTQTSMEVNLMTQTDQGFTGATKTFDSGDVCMITDQDLKDLAAAHTLKSKPFTIESGAMTVAFSGSAMGALMMRLLAGVHGGNIIKGISPLTHQEGIKVFSDLLTVRDDATLALGVRSRPFDDEGTPSQNITLIEKGVFKRNMATQDQAKKLSETRQATYKASGSATKRALFSKEIEDTPILSETNLLVEGQTSPDEDLIKNMDHGIIINSVMGAHTGNIVGGEFSLNISSAWVVEKGVVVGHLQGAMVAGNIYDLFKRIKGIGTKKEAMRGIFYTLGYSPMVVFDQVNVVV